MLRSPRIILTSLVLLCIFTLSSLWYIYPHHQSFFSAVLATKPQQSLSTVDIHVPDDVRNATLGFQKVFVLNLPERTDKLDSFAVITSLTGFAAEVINGVKGAQVQNKALPALEGLPNDKTTRDNIVGCWRAHLDFAQTIVTQNLSTALILEDDADWDVELKSQLALFAQGSQFITSPSRSSAPPSPNAASSPYGTDWDLLWLGHCGITPHPLTSSRFEITNDATVPPVLHRFNVAPAPNMTALGYSNTTRIVFRAQRGLCLYAYALSYRGARKLLRYQSQLSKFEPIDIGIGDWCERNEDVKCVGVFPQLVDSHKAAGRLSRDSDIGEYSAEESRGRGFTFNVVKSVRLNVDALLGGGVVETQWPGEEEVVGEVKVRAVERAGG